MPGLRLGLFLEDRKWGRRGPWDRGDRGKARDRDIKTLSDPWSMVLWCYQTLHQACVFSAAGEGKENNPTLNEWLDGDCVI